MISIKQINSDLLKIFDDSKVQLTDTVYELSSDGKYYKMIFSLHGIEVEVDEEKNTTVLHTKFIFRTNLQKTILTENSFWYLHDINCKYIKVDFDGSLDLVSHAQKIFHENNFGKDIKALSRFISEAPSSSINDFLFKNYVSNFSVTNVMYNPTQKISPCSNTTFDFDINLNNGEYFIKLSIKKIDANNYRFFYYMNDNIETIQSEFIDTLPQLIGDHLQYIYSKII